MLSKHLGQNKATMYLGRDYSHSLFPSLYSFSTCPFSTVSFLFSTFFNFKYNQIWRITLTHKGLILVVQQRYGSTIFFVRVNALPLWNLVCLNTHPFSLLLVDLYPFWPFTWSVPLSLFTISLVRTKIIPRKAVICKKGLIHQASSTAFTYATSLIIINGWQILYPPAAAASWHHIYNVVKENRFYTSFMLAMLFWTNS